jgi:hypothetical protein
LTRRSWHPYTALFPQSIGNPGQVAQLVERGPEKAGVGGSIPSLATIKFKIKNAKGKIQASAPNFAFCIFNFEFSPVPVVLNLLCEQREGNVFGLATGAAQFFDHAHGSIGVARVYHDGRGALQLGA